MGTEQVGQVASEVSAVRARARRRARYLEEATGPGPRSHLVSAGVSVAVGILLVVSGGGEIPLGTLGFLALLSSIGGWQYQRLNARVNALTKLLAEVGHPGEA